MTPEAFTTWLAAMKAAGLARSDAAAGRLLGKSADTIVRYKRRGVIGPEATAIALACRALLHRLEPWS